MSRLTHRDENGFLMIPNIELIKQTRVLNEYTEKLSQKEDDDEELGIDSHILFKALSGIYYRFSKNDKICKMKVPMLRIIEGEYCWICPKWMTTTWMNVKVKDYGKTWALTREELL